MIDHRSRGVGAIAPACGRGPHSPAAVAVAWGGPGHASVTAHSPIPAPAEGRGRTRVARGSPPHPDPDTTRQSAVASPCLSQNRSRSGRGEGERGGQVGGQLLACLPATPLPPPPSPNDGERSARHPPPRTDRLVGAPRLTSLRQRRGLLSPPPRCHHTESTAPTVCGQAIDCPRLVAGGPPPPPDRTAASTRLLLSPSGRKLLGREPLRGRQSSTSRPRTCAHVQLCHP